MLYIILGADIRAIVLLVLIDQSVQPLLIHVAQLHGLLVTGVGIEKQSQIVQGKMIGTDALLNGICAAM